eukprot:8502197-Alexandrium_andersonii.AAC.1
MCGVGAVVGVVVWKVDVDVTRRAGDRRVWRATEGSSTETRAAANNCPSSGASWTGVKGGVA